MLEATMPAQNAVRDQIYRQGVSPQLAADVWQLAMASQRANARWRPASAHWALRLQAEHDHSPASMLPVALADVPKQIAPFCHDVLLYRAFIGADYAEAARDWLGPCMWHLVEALGGWRRVGELPLGRMVDEALAAQLQMPSFLRPAAYELRPLSAQAIASMALPWARKYAALSSGLDVEAMADLCLTAGAWLWVFDRTDADVQRRGCEDHLDDRLMRLAHRVAASVSLAAPAS